MTKENILETHESGIVPPLSEATGSASVGRGQRLAPAIWNQFKNEEMRFVDMLELVAVLLVNVADKTQSTDHEIAHMTRKLVADMRHRASLPNVAVSEPTRISKI